MNQVGSEIKIPLFNIIEDMEDDRVTVLVAKRNSGKSTVIRDILYNKRNVIPTCVAISGSEAGNRAYGGQDAPLPDTFVYNEYNPDIINKIMQRQTTLIHKNNGKVEPQYRLMLILDDCGYDRSLFKRKEMRNLVLNGRHLGISLVISLQYAMDLGPEIRSQIDYVILLAENQIPIRQKLYTNFCGIFDTFAIFNKVFTACTQNYECLVLNNCNLQKQNAPLAYYFKATIRPPFKFGSKQFWEQHNKRYNSNYNSYSLGTKKKDDIVIRKEKKA